MRVIAGTARSMPLRTVKGLDVRPTTDRTKETLFNILMPDIPYCRFLDLFAGSGSIGIEALSRGAREAVFVEKSGRICALIKENLEFTKLIGGAKIMQADALSAVARLEGGAPFDIIFMDPPFMQGLEKDVLFALSQSSLVGEETLVVVEADPRTDFSYTEELGFETVKHKIYGKSSHLFLRKKAQI